MSHIYKEISEEAEHQEELQSSTSASILNKSNDNLGPNNINQLLDIKEEIESQTKRKFSAPITISQIQVLNINKFGRGPRSSYYNQLFCKGLLFQ